MGHTLPRPHPLATISHLAPILAEAPHHLQSPRPWLQGNPTATHPSQLVPLLQFGHHWHSDQTRSPAKVQLEVPFMFFLQLVFRWDRATKGRATHGSCELLAVKNPERMLNSAAVAKGPSLCVLFHGLDTSRRNAFQSSAEACYMQLVGPKGAPVKRQYSMPVPLG